MNTAPHLHVSAPPPVPLTPLDPWTAALVRESTIRPVSARAVEEFQLEKLRSVLAHAKENSPWYARHLQGFDPGHVARLQDVSTVPLTTAGDLREHGPAMCCVSQDEVARVVTLTSSGSTGKPKRVFFNKQDLEATLDFFDHGMRTLVESGQRVMILLSGPTPDSTGDLLSRALARNGVDSLVYGLVQDPLAALEQARQYQPHCLVGFPVQLLVLARLDAAWGTRLNPAKILLCSDYAPDSIIKYVEREWPCQALVHWGATETGLGGGVECLAQQGSHLRQADLYVEIIDPATGEPLPAGQWGEIVVTTLRRQAQPLIRYRLGDLGRLLSGTCACGSSLVRLDKVQGRLSQRPRLANGHVLGLALLDETLFRLELVVDFSATLHGQGLDQELRIRLKAMQTKGRESFDPLRYRAQEMLAALPELQDTDQGPGPRLTLAVLPWDGEPFTAFKRTLTHETRP
ncbi:MAG: phenylacetate--CoA ligase family protein [Desulfovibrio sp.]|nr:MAG: phenylacetate--CoA ligase family protein [Desulfovibrio sp.]